MISLTIGLLYQNLFNYWFIYVSGFAYDMTWIPILADHATVTLDLINRYADTGFPSSKPFCICIENWASWNPTPSESSISYNTPTPYSEPVSGTYLYDVVALWFAV